MKNIKFCLIIFIIAFLYQINHAQVPFTRGVNLTTWFQTSRAQDIQFTQFTMQDFVNIKSLGCDVIRLPINLHAMTSGSPDYIIEPLFSVFLILRSPGPKCCRFVSCSIIILLIRQRTLIRK